MRVLAETLATAVLLASLFVARAGDPIQFSNDKTKSAPSNPQQPVDADMFKSGNKTKGSVASRLNTVPYLTLRGPQALDPKEERRLKNLRDEKKNWMLLEPGELQKREEDEENEFGGKGVSIDKMNEGQERNYLFPNVTSQKSERPVRQNSPVEDDQPRKENRSMNVFGPREGEKTGAHTASELNLKNLIDPSQINAAKFNNNEASLFQFLKDNSVPGPDRDQQARRDSFRDFINGPQPNAAPSGFSDPINFRTDLTQERMNPVIPNRVPLEMSAPTKAPDGFSAKPAFGSTFTPGRAAALPDVISAAPRQPMPGPYLPSPLAIQNDPSKSSRPSVMGGAPFNREVPRRGGI